MEKHLQNLELWCWHYPEGNRRTKGLHFTASDAACDVLFDLVSGFRSLGYGTHRTIPLRPDAQQEDRSGFRLHYGIELRAFKQLRLTWHAQPNPLLAQLSFRAEGDTVLFDLCDGGVQHFLDTLLAIKAGGGDYCIGPNRDRILAKRFGYPTQLGELDTLSQNLWIWWGPSHPTVS